MWRDYAIRYIKVNKASSIFLAGISFLSAVLLSLVCGVFYNLWMDRVQRLTLKTGSPPSMTEPIVIAYLFVLVVICASLIAMIHNVFEVSMNSRLHQLGILKSVGATPRQIRSFLLQEVLVLCPAPAAVGVLAGYGLCYGFLQFIIGITDSVRKYEVIFQYHWGIGAAAFVLSVVTVLLSAWIPARHVSRLSPLEAIHSGAETSDGSTRHFRIYSCLFGIYGELARKSLYARRKALRTSTLSLLFSFLAFISFLNLEVISGISTQKTYYERFQNVWDVMFTTGGWLVQDEDLLAGVRGMDGVEYCIAYGKFMAGADISGDMFSDEMLETGAGILDGHVARNPDGSYGFQVPVYVLDNESFQTYITSNRIEGDGQAVVVNRIWDSVHSDRIHQIYVPLLNTKEPQPLKLKPTDSPAMSPAPVTVSSYTEAFPSIREYFISHSLTLIISRDLYQTMADRFPSTKVSYNIKTRTDNDSQTVLKILETQLPDQSRYTLQNRQEQETSEITMRNGLKFIMGSLSGLLACIGITNVFSSVLGQIYQRRKEFARYLCAGLSPGGMRRILMMETIIISLHPLVLSLIINIPIVAYALNSARLPADAFIAKAPIIPMFLFAAFVFFTVALAHYLGGRFICKGDMVDMLKDETMV